MSNFALGVKELTAAYDATWREEDTSLESSERDGEGTVTDDSHKEPPAKKGKSATQTLPLAFKSQTL